MSSAIICSRTSNTCASPNSSLNFLPGPLSSMQCMHARLHSLVICHATYSGAPRCWDSGSLTAIDTSCIGDVIREGPSRANGQPPWGAASGALVVAVSVRGCSNLNQALGAEVGDEFTHFDLDGSIV